MRCTPGAGDDLPTHDPARRCAATLPLVFRRTHLKTATAVITLATLFLLSSGETTPETAAAIVAQAWVFYLVAERYRGWVALTLGPAFVLLVLSSGEPTLSNVLLIAAPRSARWASAARGGSRGEVSEVRAEQAALEERARIARELHDVVAHHVSTIAIQADTARLTTPGLPAEGGERLEAIGQTARDAMTEMRRVLGVLRTEEAEGAGAAARARSRSASCWTTARAAGTPVRFALEGRVAPLAPGVELTAYRIVQEALTNARRHAPGATVEVSLRYAPDALRAVRPRRRARARRERPPGGQGLRGMQSGWRWSAASWRPAPPTAAGSCVEASAPASAVIRVVVADDQQIVREGFGALLDTQPDITVVGTAGDGARGGASLPRARARRGADGRAHAGDGRHRGDAPGRAAGGRA